VSPTERLTSREQEEKPVKPLRQETAPGLQEKQEPQAGKVQKEPFSKSLPPPLVTTTGRGEEKAESAPQTDESTWKRLQTIFRKHAEKQQKEEEQVEDQSREAAPEKTQASHLEEEHTTALRSPEEMSGSGQKAETEQESIPATPEAGLQQQASRREVESPPKAPETAEEIPTISESSAQKMTVQSSRLPEEGSLQPEEMSTQKPAAEIKSADRLAVQTPTEVERAEPSASEVPLPERETTEGAKPAVPAKEIAMDSRLATQPVEQNPPELKEPAAELAPAETQKTQLLQPLPLEEAWPVQRQTPERAPVERQAALPEEGIPKVLGLEEHAQVREALREVLPGQPTDSTVEMITPRRPRPTPGTLQEKERPAILSQPPANSPREPGFIENEEPVSVPENVETEIGPLPSDLWDLIGESPEPKLSQTKQAEKSAPSGKPVLPKEGGPEESLGTQEEDILREKSPTQVQRQESTVRPTMPMMPMSTSGPSGTAPSTLGTTDAMMFVQRSDGQEAPEGQAADTPGGTQPPAELDIDELAARVYGEVKRRLTVEWERLRRRI